MIQNIEISKIHHHPDNPRKDLGDLTELSESIKQSGVLQNLTLVPWFSTITGVGCDDPKQQEEMGYYSVIGNRRLAAAKLAGLTEVPCVVSDMDYKTQIATMLLENMQRSDLTVYEQANGIQMMMNLGETVSSISEKTGFSETTVRRRVKLLELDSEKFKKSVERGATLMDYIELEKINDIDLRNSVLDKIGTQNFKWELQNAITKEKNKANEILIVAELEKFAHRIENSSGLQYVTSYYYSQKIDINIPEDANSVEYFFVVSDYGCISLYKKSEIRTVANTEYEEKRKKNKEVKDELDKISDQAFKVRYDFVRTVSNTAAKKNIGAIAEALLWTTIDNGYVDFEFDEYANFFDIKLIEEENDEDDISELNFNIIKKYMKDQPELHLLVTTYLMLDAKNEHYYDWNNQHQDNKTLNTVYNLFEKLGYEMSDEEKSLCDGTHELFKKEPLNNGQQE